VLEHPSEPLQWICADFFGYQAFWSKQGKLRQCGYLWRNPGAARPMNEAKRQLATRRV